MEYFRLPLVVGAVMAVIVWQLDLLLTMQLVSIITNVVGSNLDQGDVHNIML
jgi:hypothetical protein